MKVLVVIPTHDRLEFVGEAIASVKAQTRQADEMVVIGNVGPGVISDAPLADRLNQVVEGSDCEAFVMLSDDDTLQPEFLARTVAEMEQRRVDIVYTNCLMFGNRDGVGCALGEWTRENIDRNTVPLVTSLCSKAAWRAAGGYVHVPLFDWDFWWRCFYSGASAFYLRESLWNYRVHRGQDSRSMDLQVARTFILARHEELRAGMSA